MRRTSAEIDAGILDVAAGMFATFGYTHTSVQQVADAVGYSKAGLLHRFGSKDSLHLGVVREGTAMVRRVLAEVTATEGADRPRRLLSHVAREALERPGLAGLVLRAADPASGEPGTDELRAVACRLVGLLDPAPASAADRLRVTLALQLVVNGAQAHHATADPERHVDPRELLPMLVDLATGVVGVGAPVR